MDKKSGSYHLNYVTKVNIIHSRTNGDHITTDMMHSEFHSFTLCYSYQKCKTESNHEETTDKPKLKDILKYSWPEFFLKMSV